MNKNSLNILMLDDDQYFRLSLKNTIKHIGAIEEASNLKEAKELIKNQRFDIALLDMQLQGDELGLDLLPECIKKNITTIILSSYGEEQTIQRAYELGCQHYLNKQAYKTHLLPYMEKIIQATKQESFIQEFFKKDFLTKDSRLFSKIKQLATINLKNSSLYISGESGVGKSLLGKLIHQLSYTDPKAPFIHLNCAELNDTLLESELFGHVKGAFTDAHTNKTGKLELANGGTLFLDEVATMSLKMQQKLLRVLEEKNFYPVGSNKLVHTNFTLVTATWEDLEEKIRKQEFRQDLYFRITGYNVHIPPLRERKEDIAHLLQHFIQSAPRQFVLQDKVKEFLKIYSWPGNVRELFKTVDYLSRSQKGIISLEDLPTHLQGQTTLDIQHKKTLTNYQKDLIYNIGLKKFIELIEKEAVQDALKQHHGKVTLAIKVLRTSASSFYRIMDKL